MAQNITYGLGGYNPELPNNNIVFIEEVPDPEPIADTQQLADALANLPTETLDALKAALGI